MTKIDSGAMKSRKPVSKPKPRPRDVAKLHPISDEMHQWSTLLEAELLTWPNITAKPMFGLRGLYRGEKIFAALPKTRGFDPAGSILLKFDPLPKALQEKMKNDSRFGPWGHSGPRWTSFTLRSADDLRDALWWLQHAHRCAKGKAAK